jgi:tetratricopeptide (TPR) repeat protein/tRNA A-37 threonylcarbamoyl transferase component Bud32
VPPGGHCPACSGATFAEDAASAASTAPIAGPPPRGLAFPRLAPGQRFGDRYTLIEEIGAGGMGQVYKAIDVRLGKTVALKLVRTGFEDQDQTLERFRRELTLAQEVTHPNVCRVYDLGEVDGTLFISMEYVDGQTLDDLIQSVGTLSTKQTIAIGRQICAGLEAIHQRRIVHRDLKPANAMIDRSGHAIVMDFGLAYHHERDRLTGQGAILGTLAYISPEQAYGQPTDARTDIYAAGLVLFEMLTGKRAPGDGGSAPLALRPAGERCPPPTHLSPEVPPEMSAIVLRCLERDPAHRYASAGELDAALARLAANLSSGISAGRVRPLPVRTPVASVTAAAVVVVALGGAGGWWTTAHRPHPVAGRRPVVAVLPLDNVSNDPGDEYLGVGIADTLITRLAGVPAVTVVSRSAALELRGRPSATVARELGATYLVNGGVQRADHRLRVTLNLVRADDSVAWGEELEGDIDDVFALHRKAAETLTEALEVSLSDTERQRLARAPTGDADAYAMYARARTLLERRDVPGNVGGAIDTLKRAVQKDPSFAQAHAALGEAYWIQYQETRDEAAVGQAFGAITEALRLDSGQPLTRFVLARLYNGTGRTDQAMEELRRVLALQPGNDDAHRLLGDILLARGASAEALAELERAVQIRPDYWENESFLGYAYYRLGRFPEAVRHFQRVTELQPDGSRGFQMLGAAYQSMGENDRALKSYEKAIAIRPDVRAYGNMGALYYVQGRYAEAARALEEAIRRDANLPRQLRYLGDSYRQLGQADKARECYLKVVKLEEDALRVNPRDADALSLMALAEAKLGRAADADRHLADAQAAAPRDKDVLYRKATVQALRGEKAEAMVTLDAALKQGYSPVLARQETDLAALRNLPGYKALVADRR